MRTLILFLSLTFFNLSLSAQDVWNDYIVGKPLVDYFTAKKIIAKEWGINYKAIFAGCTASDETLDKANAYQKSNIIYLETLTEKYGQNWMQDFELDVKKEMSRSNTKEKGIWYEIADNNKSKTFYTEKKAIAKTWGISYEVKFLTPDMTVSEKAALAELFLTNNDYLQQLNTILGQNWQDKLNQEVDFEVAKERIASYHNVWIEYVIGKPYVAYFETKKEVAKEWGINYDTQFKGCDLNKKMTKEADKVKADNAFYFNLLEQQLGKDWNMRFDRAVKKRIEKKRLSQQ